MESTPEERLLAYRLHKMTGKSFQTCLFCLKYHRGDFKKALDYCSDDASEDGR